MCLYVILLGLCYGSKFDKEYSWTATASESGWYSFRGYYFSVLTHDDKNNNWRLQLDTNSSIYAIANTTDYPIGTHEWDVYGDPCFDEPVATVKLNFNACNETEFNCNDGSCIEMNKRCDRKIDCADKSGTYNDFTHNYQI